VAARNLVFTWCIDRTFLLGVIPVLFMAYGDGITGIIRNLKYNFPDSFLHSFDSFLTTLYTYFSRVALKPALKACIFKSFIPYMLKFHIYLREYIKKYFISGDEIYKVLKGEFAEFQLLD